MTQKELKSILTYDPLLGHFTWNEGVKVTRVSSSGNAGCRDHQGYIIIRYRGKGYKAHRLAWLYMTGEWPEQVIDHINNDPSDNRWGNLRSVNLYQNAWNKRRTCRNTSGVVGVSQLKTGLWKATIFVEGHHIFLGHHEYKHQAVAARLLAEDKYFGKFKPLSP